MKINQNDNNSHSLSASIQEELRKLPPLSPTRCINRIPEDLRQVNKYAYTPLVVSIGPYHYKDERLRPMEIHKIRYLQFFLDASQSNGDINTFLDIVKGHEFKIRNCYADASMIDEVLSSDDFNRMVLIDSAFIIMIAHRYKTRSEEDDQIYGRPGKFRDVLRDIKLAENQLPFFILNDLYQTAFRPDKNDIPSFTNLAFEVLNAFSERRIPIIREVENCHLLDLLQIHYRPSNPNGRPKNLDVRTMTCPNTSRLYEAGIKFRATNSNLYSLLDIRFENGKGILTIPKLIVDDRTEFEFRNLQAFEQCHHICYHWVSDYIFFMDCLIDTPEDVDLLVRAGIIVNWMGSSEEVSNLFNSLGKNVCRTDFYEFAGISEELNSYCKQKCNHYRATLKRTYIRPPWKVISVIYAAILLILTLIQVVIGIIWRG